MNTIFGIRKPLGTAVTVQEIFGLVHSTGRASKDGTYVAAQGRIGMGNQPSHTDARSRLESQPLVDGHGNMLVLDGRIDNRAELRSLLNLQEDDTPDSLVVLTAFLRWGETSFAKLVGDWALALWSAADHSVYLARDHAGARTLYFRDSGGILQWSTYLDSFFAAGETYPLDEEYAARYLGAQPIFDLTPYKGIMSVPPAHYLVLHDRGVRRRPHWEWMTRKKIWYHKDSEYEEHFFSTLEQSVSRRDGPGGPRAAQLSGGMDSTSIVCMSDHLRRSQDSSAELIDTISYFDDSEPTWNERPFFSAVEAVRGKAGIHVEMSFGDRTFDPVDPSEGIYRLPGADSSAIAWERKIEDRFKMHGFRAILSGAGGDEVLGGVPNPFPELADHMVSGNLRRLLGRTIRWCVVDRRPVIQMLLETARYTTHLYHPPQIAEERIPGWISPRLKNYCTAGIRWPEGRTSHRLGFLPSAIDNGLAWWSILETLPHLQAAALTRYEYRYPYLDRDLVDFMFSIPREQIARPGRRRSLMRRALKGLVPTEVLERRRKAYITRGPLASLQNHRAKIEKLFSNSVTAEHGLLDPLQFRAAYGRVLNGTNTEWTSPLLRSIAFELWLRSCPQISAHR